MPSRAAIFAARAAIASPSPHRNSRPSVSSAVMISFS